MDLTLKQRFMELWRTYFPGATLPLVFYYTDDEGRGQYVEPMQPPPDHPVCFLGLLKKVFNGKDIYFGQDSFTCPGGSSYSGFKHLKMPNFEYFLSCGIEGKMEGERYKRTPQLAQKYIDNMPRVDAPAKYLVMKRWDKLLEEDLPEVVVFFSPPDVLAGLFTLDNFEEPGVTNVITPFSSGCGSILLYPNLEKTKENPRSILGMFDVSARPSVSPDTLSFAIAFKKFKKIIDCFEESFVITGSWDKVKKRIASS
ncbi:MAG: DUF169 domain-containing protein [bacterium]|nr:DUF169 domain-containing protein [bacterium]